MGHLMRAWLIVVPAGAPGGAPDLGSIGGRAGSGRIDPGVRAAERGRDSHHGPRRLSGFVDGDPDDEGAGGGSSCQYGGAGMMPGPNPPLLSVVLIKGKDWIAAGRNFALPSGCSRESKLR